MEEPIESPIDNDLSMATEWPFFAWWRLPSVPQTTFLDGLPDNCLELIADSLVSRDSSEDMMNFALTILLFTTKVVRLKFIFVSPVNAPHQTCKKLDSVAALTMSKEKHLPPIAKIEYVNKCRFYFAFRIIASEKHCKYQKFDSIREFMVSQSLTRGEMGKQRVMNMRSLSHPGARCRRLLHAAIPSVQEMYARVESAWDINNIVQLIGDAPIDTFTLKTTHFDEEMKQALLRFYENRKGKSLLISSNVLLHVRNFEAAALEILQLVDVAFHLINVVNGIYRPRWYAIFRSVVAMGGAVSVDNEVWPNGNLEGYKEHTVSFTLPRS